MAEATPIRLDAARAGAALGGAGDLRRYLPHIGLGLAAATVALGLLLIATGTRLGAPLAPFFASWDPQLAFAALIPVALFAASVALAPRLLDAGVSPTTFAAASFGLAITLTLALALARGGGTHAWSAVFGSSPEAANEYLPALPALSNGIGSFLDRFAEVAPTLPVHPSGHPPGLLLTLDALGITTPTAMAGLVVVAGALTAPLTYLLGRRLADEPVARIAALCWCFSPAALLYVATSADALYAALGTVVAVALVARGRIAPLVGSLLLAIAAFFAYSLLAVGAWAVVVLARRDGLRRAFAVAALCAAVLVGFYGCLYLLTGFDPVGAVRAAHDAYALGIARVRPYAFWLVGSPSAFLVAAGLPVAWFALRALGKGQEAALGLAAIVLVAALAGLTKAEVERIWLFMLPFACLAAATQMPRRWLRPSLALMAGQALAVETLTVTVW